MHQPLPLMGGNDELVDCGGTTVDAVVAPLGVVMVMLDVVTEVSVDKGATVVNVVIGPAGPWP